MRSIDPLSTVRIALSLTCLVAPVALSAQAPKGTPASEVLTTWFRHIERNEVDSLRALLTDDFVFVADGKRLGANDFVAMIKGLGIKDPRVRLSNIDARERSDVAYLIYDRDETIQSGTKTVTYPETGAILVVRERSRWKIAQWTATAPSR